ncbi:hypothetical protein THAOC_26261, partial [Thalassiosira oceanica]
RGGPAGLPSAGGRPPPPGGPVAPDGRRVSLFPPRGPRAEAASVSLEAALPPRGSSIGVHVRPPIGTIQGDLQSSARRSREATFRPNRCSSPGRRGGHRLDDRRRARDGHSGKFSTIALQGRVLEQKGVHGSIERDEAVPGHRSGLNSDFRGE